MKDLHILLTSVASLMFCWNCIKVVYMTEDWLQPTIDQVVMFIIIILGSGFAFKEQWWFTLFLFAFTLILGIINIKIQDGFLIQKHVKMFREAEESNTLYIHSINSESLKMLRRICKNRGTSSPCRISKEDLIDVLAGDILDGDVVDNPNAFKQHWKSLYNNPKPTGGLNERVQR